MPTSQRIGLFQILEEPGALPGCCLSCSGHRGGKRVFFIDFGRQMEFYGAVYICNLCLKEMATNCGYIAPEDAVKVKAENDFLRRQVYELTRRVDGLESANRALLGSGYTSVGLPDPLGDSVPEAAESSEQKSSGGEGSLDGREEGPSESLHDKGMADVSGGESVRGGFDLI